MQDDLDRESGEPLYRQLAAKLRERIAADKLTRLPSWRTLQQEYGVSRSTVEDAVEILKEAGEVYSADGKGTYVRRGPE